MDPPQKAAEDVENEKAAEDV